MHPKQANLILSQVFFKLRLLHGSKYKPPRNMTTYIITQCYHFKPQNYNLHVYSRSHTV